MYVYTYIHMYTYICIISIAPARDTLVLEWISGANLRQNVTQHLLLRYM